MKSLSAWSVDRDDAVRTEQLQATERAEVELEFASSLGDISEVLVGTLSFYAIAELQRWQQENLKQWIKHQGDLVQTSISEQTSKLRENLVNAMAGAVEPLLKEVIEKKAVDDFCDALEKTASRSIGENSIISVPERLHAGLLAEMVKRGMQVQVEVSGTEEISIDCGDTHIETRIGTVVEELSGVLG